VTLLQLPTEPQTQIIDTVQDLSGFLIASAIALAIVGVMTMALVEAWKRLSDTRTRFHARRITGWIRKSMEHAIHKLPLAPEAASTEAIREIIQFCTGVSRVEAEVAANGLVKRNGRLAWDHSFSPAPAHMLFALDTDRMMGALQEASEVALASPRRLPALYAFITTGGQAEDVTKWFDEAEKVMTHMPEIDQAGTHRQTVKDLSECAARLRTVMKRRLDSFQLRTTEKWTTFNQGTALLVGFVVMVLSLSWFRGIGILSSWYILPLAISGGIFAPLAKDLTGALKRARNA